MKWLAKNVVWSSPFGHDSLNLKTLYLINVVQSYLKYITLEFYHEGSLGCVQCL